MLSNYALYSATCPFENNRVILIRKQEKVIHLMGVSKEFRKLSLLLLY